MPKQAACSSAWPGLGVVPEQGGQRGDGGKALLFVVRRQVSEGEQLGRWLFSPWCSCVTMMSQLQNEMIPAIVVAESGWHISRRFCC